jgi:tetratricopeptide (TPR) repeat protein
VAVALFVGTALVFAPALDGGFVWDDDFNLVGNPNVHGLGGAQLRWMLSSAHLGHYHPLTWLSFAFDHRFYGLAPWGYHLTNLLLHAANAVLVYAVLLALWRAPGGPGAPPRAQVVAAGLGALLFALHPLRVESVAWVTERRGLLCAFFSLLCVLGYVRAWVGERRAAGWLAFSLGAFALSLLAKASSMTLPLVLVVLDWYPLRRVDRVGWPRLLVEKVPYAVLAGAAAAGAVWAASAVGAMSSLAQHGVMGRLVQAAYGVSFYLWQALVPLRLSPLYPIEAFDPWAPAVLAAAAAAILATIVIGWRYARSPGVAGAWACYLLLLAPVLGLAQSGVQFAADRYTYMAMLPFVALAAGGLAALLGRRPARGRTLVVAAVLGIAGLGLLARAQIPLWHDPVALWAAVVARYPGSSDAWHNLGLGRLGTGDARGALADLDRAVELAPEAAPAYNTRGTAREALHDLVGARADFDRAIALAPAWPDPYNNRGNVRLAGGDAAGAVGDYDRVLTLAPGHTRALFNRALARERQQDVAGARADIDALLALVPDYAYGYATRVRYRAALGDLEGALADCDRALALLPAGSADARTVEGYRATLRARRHAPSPVPSPGPAAVQR